MVGSDQIIIDEVEMGVHIIRNKIGEIFQDVFVREVNRLIYVAVNEHRDGCKMDDLSQLHHTCYYFQVSNKTLLKFVWPCFVKCRSMWGGCMYYLRKRTLSQTPPSPIYSV